MTWSIIARDAASGAFGVAIATRFFAVGALCPYAQSGVGALSTQALMNPHYGPQGLELLRAGVAAPEVVKRLIAPDEGREQRQVHVIDARMRIAREMLDGDVAATREQNSVQAGVKRVPSLFSNQRWDQNRNTTRLKDGLDIGLHEHDGRLTESIA